MPTPAATRLGFRPAASRSASDRIIDAVLSALFKGALKSGDRLGGEQELAASFGVSRLPVRDAMKALAAMGLLDIRVGKDGGAFIARPGADHMVRAMAVQFSLSGVGLDAIIDAQQALEVEIVRRAAARRKDDDIAALAAILDDLERSGEGEDALRHGMAFHARLAEAAGNPVLALQLRSLLLILHEHYAPTSSPARTAWAVASHRRLLALIAAGDGEAAARHVVAHIAESGRLGAGWERKAEG